MEDYLAIICFNSHQKLRKNLCKFTWCFVGWLWKHIHCISVTWIDRFIISANKTQKIKIYKRTTPPIEKYLEFSYDYDFRLQNIFISFICGYLKKKEIPICDLIADLTNCHKILSWSQPTENQFDLPFL